MSTRRERPSTSPADASAATPPTPAWRGFFRRRRATASALTVPTPTFSASAERLLGLGLLTAAVVFALAMLWPIMQHGYAAGGDDVVHMAYNHEAESILDHNKSLFGWSYLFGVGAPIFLFRPPLQYATVVGVHALLGGTISLSVIHKMTYVVFLGLYPASVYYLMRKLRLRPLMAAVAALFAVTPISMWGHTIDAYFRLGIAKQLIAIFLFPLAMGKVHGTVSQREPVLPAAFLVALCFLSHPYVPYCLLLVNAVYVFTVLLGVGWRAAWNASVRYALVWILAGGLLALYLAPFYTSPEIQALEFSSTWRHGFEVVCSTTAKTINHYFTGGIFDTTRWGVYGGGEWGWQNNSNTGRWPILTALSLVGIVVCVRQRRVFPFALLLSAFILSFLLFLGPDDLPILEHIPFQENFQYIHEIFLLDVFAICLAGIGGGAILAWVVDRSPAARLPPLAVTLVILLTALAVFMPWRDRWLVGGRIIRTTTFDTHRRQITEVARRTPVNADFDEMLTILRNPEHPGRFYGAPQGSASGQELFYFTILPGLCNRTDVICGFFSAEVAGANKTLIEQFRNEIPKSRNLIELLNVRYLIAATANRPALAPADAYADIVKQNRYWILWRVRDPFNHFDVLRTRPLAVVGDIEPWRVLNHHWLERFQVATAPASFPYLIRVGDPTALTRQLDPNEFSGLLVLGHDTHPSPAVLDALRAYQQNGGRLWTQRPIDGLTAERLPDANEIDYPALGTPSETSGVCLEAPAERERHTAEVTVSEDAFVLFKMAYYASWVAEVDGRRADLCELSPGFLGVRVPAGTHTVVFRYDGPNNRRHGVAITLAFLAAGILLTLLARVRIPALQRVAAWLRPDVPSVSPSSRLRALGIGAVWALVLVALAVLYVREQFLRIPIPVRPASGALMDTTDILLDWNAIDATGVVYDTQITDSGRSFDRLVYARGDIDTTAARKQRGLVPDSRYWWRVRSRIGRHVSPWSSPVSFRTMPDPRQASTGPWGIELACSASPAAQWPLTGHSNLPDGSYIHLRLYRDDTGQRIQSTAVRLIDGRFAGQLVAPAAGWPTNVPLSLHADFLMDDQTYPVTDTLTPSGANLATRPLDPDHVLLQGLTTSLELQGRRQDRAHSPGADQPADPARGLMLNLSAGFAPDGRLRVEGRTTFPNYTMAQVTITPAPMVDPLMQQTANVLNGAFTLDFEVPQAARYTITARISPDRQYESVRAVLGERGDVIAARRAPDSQPLLGLRHILPMGIVSNSIPAPTP